MAEASHKEYAAELTEILERRGVPAAAVTQIVREVQSHIADSVEDPVAVFGTAREYADNVAPEFRMARLWMLIVSSVVLAAGGGLVLISGVFALLSPAHGVWGLPAWTLVSAGAAGIASFIALVLLSGAHAGRRSLSWHI